MKKHTIAVQYFKERLGADIDLHIKNTLAGLGVLEDKGIVDEKKILYLISKDLAEHFAHISERFKA